MSRSLRRSGDEDAGRFESFYASHYEPIFAYAMRRTQAVEDAADVVAETFLTAWRRRDQVPAGHAARLWLFGIARRVTANHVRGRLRYERLRQRIRLHVSTSGAVVEPLDGDVAPVAAAFQRLSPGDRDLLLMVAVEGLSSAELARVVGCSATTARVRLHRARTRFARQLKLVGVEV
ncbi:MAG TPA: RNA polymerase sigma factor [Micromonosporaceae bacterium]